MSHITKPYTKPLATDWAKIIRDTRPNITFKTIDGSLAIGATVGGGKSIAMVYEAVLSASKGRPVIIIDQETSACSLQDKICGLINSNEFAHREHIIARNIELISADVFRTRTLDTVIAEVEKTCFSGSTIMIDSPFLRKSHIKKLNDVFAGVVYTVALQREAVSNGD